MAYEMKVFCRLCATADADHHMLDIFAVGKDQFNIFENVGKHLGIWVSEDESLPTMACRSCVEKLHLFSNFHSDCQKAQQFFVKMCSDPETQDDVPLASLLCSIDIVDENLDDPVKQEVSGTEEVKDEHPNEDDDDDVDDAGFDYTDSTVLLSECLNGKTSDFGRFLRKKRSTRQNAEKDTYDLPRKKKLKRKAKRFYAEDLDVVMCKKVALCLKNFFVFECHICKCKCENWYRLKMHTMSKHQQIALVKCLVCGLIFKSRSTIYRHVSNHNDPSMFRCDQCSRVTKTEESLERHKLKHNPKPDTVYQCTECPKMFTAKENLKSHQRVHIPKEERYVYPCEICGTKFTTKSAVSSHRRSVHDKIKRFMCDICGYSCSTRGELAQHRAIHSEEKLHPCSMCQKSFKTSSNLKAHMDTHSITSYDCPHCDKVLNSRRTLRKHLLVHDDECRHICSFCNKAFKRRQTLKVHLTTHTGDTPIQCPWCTQKFAYSSAFRSHKQKNHPQEYAMQQKMYQESMPKVKGKSGALINKQDSSHERSFDEDMSLLDRKIFQNEMQTKQETDIVLIHKEEHLQQKNYENGLATLKKRHDITLIPYEPKLGL